MGNTRDAALARRGPAGGRRGLLRRAWADAEPPPRAMLLCAIALAASILFPSDLESYRDTPQEPSALATAVDEYVRFVNTAAQVGLPLLERDPIGLLQSVYVALSTTAATHGLKYLLDSRTIRGVRLGERPSGPSSRNNMPSGHSSMASSAAWFVSRRYGWRHLWYLLPILLLAMYARVAIDAHTISAVLAGAIVGALMAMLFTGRRRRPGDGDPVGYGQAMRRA